MFKSLVARKANDLVTIKIKPDSSEVVVARCISSEVPPIFEEAERIQFAISSFRWKTLKNGSRTPVAKPLTVLNNDFEHNMTMQTSCRGEDTRYANVDEHILLSLIAIVHTTL